MNMKKTIAAVAAGAMAVSAMASSVSALELQDPQNFNYSLLKTESQPTSLGQVTINATISEVDLDSQINGKDPAFFYAGITIPAGYKIKSVTTSGYYSGNYKDAIPAYTRVPGNSNSLYFETVDNGYIKMPIAESGINSGAWLKPDANATIQFAIVLEHNGKSYSDINNDMFTGEIAINSLISNEDLEANAGFTATPLSLVNGDTNTTHTKRINNGVFQTYSGGTWQDISSSNYADAKTGTAAVTTMSATDRTDAGSTDYTFPFESTFNSNLDIVTYLQNTASSGYGNIAPVINDMLGRYEMLTFTFHTANKKVKWVVTGANDYKIDTGADGIVTDGVDTYTSYEAAYRASDPSTQKVRAIYSDASDAINKYTMFDQYLYGGNASKGFLSSNGWKGYGSSETYFGDLWNQMNLFMGGLVVNENYTMTLSDVQSFDYGAGTVTFDWDSITANSSYANQFVTYVQNLKLVTTDRWYWDSMDVTGTTLYAEDAGRYNVTAGAGETAAESEITIPEETQGTDEITVPTAEETTAETTADTTAEASETEAAEQPAENPKTGNAPVALAVIPVALAAAAVVAKKRS